jgi:hypothetical protein
MTGIGQVVPLAETQFDAITAAASARAVFAAPVFEADGTVCEVGIYSNGELAGTVFRQRGGGLKIWTENRKCEVADAAEAVRLIVGWASPQDRARQSYMSRKKASQNQRVADHPICAEAAPAGRQAASGLSGVLVAATSSAPGLQVCADAETVA